MRTASTTLPGDPSSVPTARRWADSVLSAWGLEAAGWNAAQVVSELATNSTLHARTEFTVRLTADETAVRLEVTDGSPLAPQQRTYGDTATTGRGLHIVEVLSLSWGVTHEGAGKTVWVQLASDGAVEDTTEAVVTPLGAAGRQASARPSSTVVLRRAA